MKSRRRASALNVGWKDYWPAPKRMSLVLAWRGLPRELRPSWSDRESAWLPKPNDTAMRAYEHAYYLSDVAKNRDARGAVRCFREAACQGNFDALNDLAVHYWNGDGVRRDRAMAIELFEVAHELGDRIASLALAKSYTALGRTRRAFGLYLHLAVTGFIPAYSKVALHLSNRRDTRSRHDAVRWYERVLADPVDVEQKRDAQFRLATLHERGRGTKRDMKRALQLYRAAARNGDGGAHHELGWLYCNGVGVTKDSRRGLDHYRQAAELGNAVSMFNLGVEYSDGGRVVPDARLAAQWFTKAAKHGHPKAGRYLARLRRR